MANVTLMGASYTDVPAVTLPQTGGGTVTFYENGGGGGGYTLTTVAAQQTVTPTSNGTYYGATLTVSTGLEAGADYIITINGTEYYYTCQLLWGTNYLLGDANYFYGSTGLPYPFGIIWMSGSTCTLAAGDGTTLTIKIEKIELVDEPITPPVLVTKSITANGTYNAEDDSADGYSSVTVNVSGGSSVKTKTGTFTGNGTRQVTITCDFEPDLIYWNSDPGTTASSGTVSGIIARGMMAANRYRNNNTTNSHYAVTPIADMNTGGSSYSHRATYENSTVTLYSWSSNARSLFTNNRTYSYTFIKWTS